MLGCESGNALASGSRRGRRRDDGYRVGQGAIGQAIDHAVAFPCLFGRSAELLRQGDTLFGIDRERPADGRCGRLCGDRQRHGPAGPDAGDDRRPIGAAAGRALHLLTQGFDVRDRVDAVPVIPAEGCQIGLEIDADDERFLARKLSGNGILPLCPAAGVRKQHHGAGSRLFREQDVRCGDHAGVELCRVFGKRRKGCSAGNQCRQGCTLQDPFNGGHFLITPFRPPPIRNVASISARIGLKPPLATR